MCMPDCPHITCTDVRKHAYDGHQLQHKKKREWNCTGTQQPGQQQPVGIATATALLLCNVSNLHDVYAAWIINAASPGSARPGDLIRQSVFNTAGSTGLTVQRLLMHRRCQAITVL
jgi:hypothetical protein